MEAEAETASFCFEVGLEVEAEAEAETASFCFEVGLEVEAEVEVEMASCCFEQGEIRCMFLFRTPLQYILIYILTNFFRIEKISTMSVQMSHNR